MLIKKWVGLLVLGFLALLSTGAHAGPIVVDAGWHGFCFGGVGSAASAGCQNDGIGVSGNPTTFVAAGPVIFKITDAFDHGDRFDVSIDAGASSSRRPWWRSPPAS